MLEEVADPRYPTSQLCICSVKQESAFFLKLFQGTFVKERLGGTWYLLRSPDTWVLEKHGSTSFLFNYFWYKTAFQLHFSWEPKTSAHFYFWTLKAGIWSSGKCLLRIWWFVLKDDDFPKYISLTHSPLLLLNELLY